MADNRDNETIGGETDDLLIVELDERIDFSAALFTDDDIEADDSNYAACVQTQCSDDNTFQCINILNCC